MAAQFAAEATLRRVHAAQKDDDMPPIEAILAPLEAELKLARQEVCAVSCSMLLVNRVQVILNLSLYFSVLSRKTCNHLGTLDILFLIARYKCFLSLS